MDAQLLVVRLLELIARAAEALPLILAMGLIVGRRGHAAFCLAGGNQLLRCARLLGCLGLIYLPCVYALLLIPLGGGIDAMLLALATSAGAPWLVGFCAWLIGLGLLFGVRLEVRGLTGDRYQFWQIRAPFWLLLASSALFFVALAAPDWPGAGLPQGLDWDRALMAIARHSLHSLFGALCPAGALALVFVQLPAICQKLENFAKDRINGIRWLAFWAAIGYLPMCLQNLGVGFGLLLSGHTATLSSAFAAQLTGSVCQALGMIFWFSQLLSKQARPWRSLAGLVCLGAYAAAPLLARFWA